MTMVIEDREMEMPEGRLAGAKFNADVPSAPRGKVPWFVPGMGWTVVTQEFADKENARYAAERAERVLQAHITRQATKRPRRWPAKYHALILKVREMADDGWRWTYNHLDKAAVGVPPGGLLLVHDDGRELEFASLAEASADLVGTVEKVVKTTKAQLVKFLTSTLDHLPPDAKAEAARLLEEA